MAKMLSLKQHLEKATDALHAASQENDAEMKRRIEDALMHAELARADLKARFDSGITQNRAHAEKTRDHLAELADNGRQALHEAGGALHARLSVMEENAKHAQEAAHHLN